MTQQQLRNIRMQKLRALMIFAIVFGVQLALFQNCAPLTSFTSARNAETRSGNGDAYTGKPDPFRYYDSSTPCSDLDRKGKPLPNDEIFFQGAGSPQPYLVREGCVDIAPTSMSWADLKFTNSVQDTLVFKGKTFSNLNAPLDFDVVANNCPGGRTLIPGAVRSNLFASSLNWDSQGTPGWYIHQGISVNLMGSIFSLQGYEVRRSDASMLEDWRRASQMLTLNANTSYAFSFLARPGSIGKGAFHVVRGGPPAESLSVTFDLQNGSAVVDWATNFSAVSAVVTPVGNGYFCTVYFTTSASANLSISDIGVAPATNGAQLGNFGDSIFATAAQLERVNDFCQ